MPQSRASMLIARVMGPQPGQRVLDLCAAPGAKTTHLAALMDAEGELVAVELRRARAQALSQTCLRMGASWVSVEVGDASSPRPEWQARFDSVLVDPPCSGLGTLQSRPDIRWRANPQQIEELTALQSKILAAGAQATAPGGTLVYSVCTISRAESVDVVESFLRSAPEFGAEPLTVEGAEPLTAQAGEPLPAQGADWTRLPGTPYLQLLPHRYRTDGFFVARLRRA